MPVILVILIMQTGAGIMSSVLVIAMMTAVMTAAMTAAMTAVDRELSLAQFCPWEFKLQFVACPCGRGCGV